MYGVSVAFFTIWCTESYLFPTLETLFRNTSKFWLCMLFIYFYGNISNSNSRAIVNPQHSIDFPRVAENHDPLVIDVLKICLVRDPVHRASIAELLSHPYLKTSSKKAQESDNCLLDSSAGQPRVDDVLSAFSSLTPNSKRMFVEKIVQSGK